MVRDFRLAVIVCGVGGAAFVANTAKAEMYGFFNITNNSAVNAATAAQFNVNVTDAGGGRALFTFTNSGPMASSITDVYFDDGDLLVGITQITNGAGVDFSVGSSPPNLPGGNSISPGFQTSSGAFAADSNPPTQPMGVNPGESLGIILGMESGVSISDIISNLHSPFTAPEGGLRIGIHVQGFANGGSESFINSPPAVPAPGAIMLGGLGLGMVTWLKRRSA